MTRRLGPVQLARLAVGGAALAASVWFLSFVHIPRLPAQGCGFWAMLWSDRLRFLAFGIPGLTGLTTSIWAERTFNRGFRNDVWTEAELEPVRRMTKSRGWAWMGWLALVMGGLMLAFWKHTQSGALIYILFLPLQAVTRIRMLISPRVTPKGGLVDRQNFKPIRSERWGEGRT